MVIQICLCTYSNRLSAQFVLSGKEWTYVPDIQHAPGNQQLGGTFDDETREAYNPHWQQEPCKVAVERFMSELWSFAEASKGCTRASGYFCASNGKYCSADGTDTLAERPETDHLRIFSTSTTTNWTASYERSRCYRQTQTW